MTVRLLQGDCRRAMRLMARRGIMVDAIVCDPPYHLTSIVKRFGGSGAYGGGFKADGSGTGAAFARMSRGFMGKKWDGGDVAGDPETWKLAAKVLKPGGHLLAFGGTRGWHRMACAIEDAGFEIRDTVAWLYGSGFPKSHNAATGIAKHFDPAWETGVDLPPEARRAGAGGGGVSVINSTINNQKE